MQKNKCPRDKIHGKTHKIRSKKGAIVSIHKNLCPGDEKMKNIVPGEDIFLYRDNDGMVYGQIEVF